MWFYSFPVDLSSSPLRSDWFVLWLHGENQTTGLWWFCCICQEDLCVFRTHWRVKSWVSFPFEEVLLFPGYWDRRGNNFFKKDLYRTMSHCALGWTGILSSMCHMMPKAGPSPPMVNWPQCVITWDEMVGSNGFGPAVLCTHLALPCGSLITGSGLHGCDSQDPVPFIWSHLYVQSIMLLP